MPQLIRFQQHSSDISHQSHQQMQMQQMQQQHQHQHQHQQQAHNLMLERRIIELLTSTNLTFKEIITKLDGENLSASIGIIRRINRDNRYRRPRYDSKLTPAQRESLVSELRDHKGLKPNLSLLAKRYGVCHGSVWYWWDKLNRIKRGTRAGAAASAKLGHRGVFFAAAAGVVGGAGPALGHQGALEGEPRGFGVQQQQHQQNRRRRQQQLRARATRHRRQHGPGASLFLADGQREDNDDERERAHERDQEQYDFVGRVGIVTHGASQHIDLPILMFSRRQLLELARTSPLASEASLEPASPSPMVVVDDDDGDHDDQEEDEEDVEEDEVEMEEGQAHEFDSLLDSSSSPLLGSSSSSSAGGSIVAACRYQDEPDEVEGEEGEEEEDDDEEDERQPSAASCRPSAGQGGSRGRTHVNRHD